MVEKEKFHEIHSIGRLLASNHIIWNPITKVYETHNSVYIIIVRTIIFFAVLCLELDSMYYILTKSGLDKCDLIFLFQLPILIIGTVIVYPYSQIKEKDIIGILQALQEIDKALNFENINLYKRSAQKSVKMKFYTYLILVIVLVFSVFMFFMRADLRPYLICVICAPLVLCNVFSLSSYITILSDRTSLFCDHIANSANYNVPSENCFKCNDTVKGHILCVKHMILYVKAFTPTILNLASKDFELYQYLSNPMIVGSIPLGPIYLMYITNIVFGKDRMDYLKLMIICLSGLFAIIYVFTMAINASYLNNQISKLARKMHKLYNKSTCKDDIRTDVFCVSTFITQERPFLYFFGCIEFIPETIAALISGVIMFSVMIVQFNVSV